MNRSKQKGTNIARTCVELNGLKDSGARTRWFVISRVNVRTSKKNGTIRGRRKREKRHIMTQMRKMIEGGGG